MFDVIRPIGSLYPTVDSTFNPNNATGWHGTWERITDCMIYASGDSDTVGEIVGSNTHALNGYELPLHNHIIPSLTGTATGGSHRHTSDNYLFWGNNANDFFGVTVGSSGAASYHGLSKINTNYSGSLSMSVSTDASNTGNAGASSPIDLRSRRINSIVWKRIA